MDHQFFSVLFFPLAFFIQPFSATFLFPPPNRSNLGNNFLLISKFTLQKLMNKPHPTGGRLFSGFHDITSYHGSSVTC